MKSSRLLEALALLREARNHVDNYGKLDSEGRTLVSKALKLIKRDGIYVNTRKLRERWTVEEVDRVIAQILDIIEESSQ